MRAGQLGAAEWPLKSSQVTSSPVLATLLVAQPAMAQVSRADVKLDATTAVQAGQVGKGPDVKN